MTTVFSNPKSDTSRSGDGAPQAATHSSHDPAILPKRSSKADSKRGSKSSMTGAPVVSSPTSSSGISPPPVASAAVLTPPPVVSSAPLSVNTDPKRESHSSMKSRGSLGGVPTSSRPAPPSPARSAHSQSASRRSSRHTTDRRSKGSRLSQLSMSQFTGPSAKRQSKLASQPEMIWKAEIRIIDFGFNTPSDPRRTGLGDHVPKPNRPAILNSRLGAAPPHPDDDDDEDEEEEEDKTSLSGWWSGGLSRLSWTFGNRDSGSRGDDSKSSDGSFPHKSDLDRNFGDDDDEYESGEEGDEDVDVTPGLYKAVYEFEPEGETEMKLVEDQIVKVIGKGGGVGWAVVEKDDGSQALVPESYLEWFGEIEERR